MCFTSFFALLLCSPCSTGASSEVHTGSAKGSTGNTRTSTPRTSKIGGAALGLSLSPRDSHSHGAALNLNLNLNAGAAAGAGAMADDISEIQSVLSETDKESLDVAMSMMGHLELRQVEDEVSSLLPYAASSLSLQGPVH